MKMISQLATMSWRRPASLLAACFLLSAVVDTASAQVARLPFRSSFEAGSFGEWQGGLDASMSVTTDQATDGRYSARSVHTPGVGNDNYKEFRFGDHPTVNGAGVSPDRGIWLTFDSRFDSGFTFSRIARLHKIAIVNFEDESNRRRYQLILNIWRDSERYFVEHLNWNADRSFNRALPALEQNVGTPVTVRRGQWDKFKFFIKPNHSGQSDGVVKVWINDVLKIDYSNVAMRENTNYLPNKLIMSNYAPDTDISGTQRWDNFYLGEQEPSGTVRPNPPVLQSVQ